MKRTAALALAALVAAAAGCGSVESPGPPTWQEATASATPQSPSVPTQSPTVAVDSFAPPGWVDLATVDPTIMVEIRYQGSHNFVGRPVAGYLEPRCLLPERTAQALATVAQAARERGYSLKLYDCYRPLRAGADFVAWRDSRDEAMRAEFYPRLTKAEVFSRGYVAGGRSAHSSGSAVDLTLVKLLAAKRAPYEPADPLVACTAPAGHRFDDGSVDMGTGYDCFDSRSHTLDASITGSARENRLLLRDLMGRAAFVNAANEWWHYDLEQPPYPGRFFDFPVAAGALT